MADYKEIQKELQAEQIDGWLLYDFHGSNAIARSIAGLSEDAITTRRWYYWIPSTGEPTRIVHAIERGTLDHLPGNKIIFQSWSDLHNALRTTLKGRRKVAMEYSPENDIPYISKVDAGTVDLIRGMGVEIVSSGDLVQLFEARWDSRQTESHFEAAKRVNDVKDSGFRFVAENLNAGKTITEYDVQQYMWELFATKNLIADHPAIVAVNANASNPHYLPAKEGSAVVKKGDLVLIDIWGKLKEPDSIYGDITWMGYAGAAPVPQKYETVFHIVKQAQKAAFDLIARNFRAGRSTYGWEADEAARTVIRDAGYGDFYWHRTGHNIGREVHGNGAHLDNLETRDQRKLIQHTGFSIEPGIYQPEFGIRSEVDVYIGETGPVITSPEQTEIIPLL